MAILLLSLKNNMKKVLLATRPLVPPWDEASKNFAYFLGKSIQDQTITLLGNKTPLQGLPPTNTVLPIFEGSHFSFREKLRLFFFLWKNKYCFDVTHYLFTPTPQNTTLIKKFLLPKKGKTVQTVATLRDDLYSPKQLQEMFFADAIVTYTNQTRKKLEAIGVTGATCIYPGIDLTLYKKQPKDEGFLTSLQLDRSHFIIVYPGEYVRLGATDHLTEFCVSFFTQNPDTPIRFVFANRIKNAADANKKNQVEQKLKEAGVLEYVRFTDTVPNMPTLYNIADVVIFPVLNLAGKFDVPLVIPEAYACEKPVILSNLKDFSEFSDDSFCVTIQPGDVYALTKAIEKLSAHPDECQKLGSNAREFVKQNFDLTKTADQYSALYKSL